MVGWLLHPGSMDWYTEICVCCPGVNERSRCGITGRGDGGGGGRGQITVRASSSSSSSSSSSLARTRCDPIVPPPPPPLCIHFSCVHYITIIIIFPYNSTIVIQESTGRDEVREYKEPSAYTP